MTALRPALFDFNITNCDCNCECSPTIYINHNGDLETFDAKKSKNHEQDYAKSMRRLIEKIQKTQASNIQIIPARGSVKSYDVSEISDTAKLKLGSKLNLKTLQKINQAYMNGTNLVLITPKGFNFLSKDSPDVDEFWKCTIL